MKIAHIVGARPQFIKAALLSKALRSAGLEEVLIHSGQHYDDAMSAVFFDELGLPQPDYRFTVTSQISSAQTGEMVANLESCMEAVQPDLLIVHGDTNTTLAGALVASKLELPLAHNEAGLRSYNREMPEEHNRVITDHCSALLFCTSESARERLAMEGLERGVHVTGDVMYDAALHYAEAAREQSRVKVPSEAYALVTVHRAYTADHRERLARLMAVLEAIPMPVVFPVHPRTAARLTEFDLTLPGNVIAIAPVGYFDMLALEQRASWILTDSGGVQKEAYFFGVPCLTLRPETEWKETVDAGWNTVTNLDAETVAGAMAAFDRSRPRPQLFGDGRASEAIAQIILTSRFEKRTQ